MEWLGVVESFPRTQSVVFAVSVKQFDFIGTLGKFLIRLNGAVENLWGCRLAAARALEPKQLTGLVSYPRVFGSGEFKTIKRLITALNFFPAFGKLSCAHADFCFTCVKDFPLRAVSQLACLFNPAFTGLIASQRLVFGSTSGTSIEIEKH
jgi:hypothetical protein